MVGCAWDVRSWRYTNDNLDVEWMVWEVYDSVEVGVCVWDIGSWRCMPTQCKCRCGSEIAGPGNIQFMLGVDLHLEHEVVEVHE